MRIADPRPPMCSACLNTKLPPERYVDFETEIDGVPVLDPDTRAVALEPSSGLPMNNDSIILCEACVKEAAQAIEFKPDLHQRQIAEIKRLNLAVEHWRERARRTAHALEADVPDGKRRAA